jgi:probable selenium-dependent hydroxylase accessory protein YqeC
VKALFFEQFDFSFPALVNFVGGGGKTALILRLLEEAGHTRPVLYTTTTRIHPPHPAGGLSVISCDDLQVLKAMLSRAANANIPEYCRLVATRLPVGPSLLGGVPVDFARELRGCFPLILNEADGARSMSLKLPRAGEPVLMEGAECLVAVIGLDCLYKPMAEAVFRFDALGPRYSLNPAETVTPRTAASILLHPEGVCRDFKQGMRLVVYINKVDSDADERPAHELAYAAFNNGLFPVERVVLGSTTRSRASSLTARRQ